MSDLRKRLKDAKRKRKREEEFGLLPASIVEDFLSGHPLISKARLRIEDVHNAIVRLHSSSGIRNEKRESREDEKEEERECASCKGRCVRAGEKGFFFCTCCGDTTEGDSFEGRTSPSCACGGYADLDGKEGTLVCRSCGACLQERMNIVPEFVSFPFVKRTKKDRIPGVGRKTILSMWKEKGGGKSAYYDCLVSWNEEFLHLPIDDVELADRLLVESGKTGADVEVQCAAALLYVRIRDRLPNEGEIRKKLMKREPLLEVSYHPPPPLFPCGSCSKLHHVRKSARYCCKSRGT